MATFSRRFSRWLLGIVALVAAVLVLAPMAVGQGFPFAYPQAPNGTPVGYVPVTVNTTGAAQWQAAALDGGSNVGVGVNGQVYVTQGGVAQWGNTIGDSGVTTNVLGNFQQEAGTWSFSGNGASSATTTSGNTTIDSAGQLQLGLSSATSVQIGNTATPTAVSRIVKSSGTISDQVNGTTILSETLTAVTMGDPTNTASQTFNVATNDPFLFASNSANLFRMQSPGGSAFQAGMWCGGVSNADTNVCLGTDSSHAVYLNSPFGTLYFGTGSGYVVQIAGSILSPASAGGGTLGSTSLPWGATNIGAGNAGYHSTTAITGTHNTQDNILQDSTFDLRTTNASFGPFNAQTYTLAAHHGVTIDCEATGRVVTSGAGGTFWTVAADNTYGCRAVATAAYTGAAGLGNAVTYPHCDCSGGACSSVSTPTNPLLVFAASINTGTGVATVTWATYNDGSTTKPIVDIISHCLITDD